MAKTDLFIGVPTYFRCPISLELMKSPVSLATGVTYDRSSIQTWLEHGNDTCPATMQVLHTKDVIPNHTVHRLIQMWLDSVKTQPESDEHHVRKLLLDIKSKPSVESPDQLKQLADFAIDSDKNKAFLVNSGCVPLLARVLAHSKEIRVLEEAIRVLDLVLSDRIDKETIRNLASADLVRSLRSVLEKGRVESRIQAGRVLETIAIDKESQILIAETDGVLSELLRLINSDTASTRSIRAGLSCLVAVSNPRRIRSQIVQLGFVPVLGKLLGLRSSDPAVPEKALKVLERVSASADGRTAICEDPACVPAIVERVLKVSRAATESAVVVLWSLCHVFRHRKAEEAVRRSNGLTKMLLVLQSNCSAAVRQMSGDLIKIYRADSKGLIEIYDSKTTHIRPF